MNAVKNTWRGCLFPAAFCSNFLFLFLCTYFCSKISCVDIIKSAKIVQHVVAQIGVVARLSAEKAKLLHHELVCVMLLFTVIKTLPISQPVMPGVVEGWEKGRFRYLADRSALLIFEETRPKQGLECSGSIVRAWSSTTSVMSLAHVDLW